MRRLAAALALLPLTFAAAHAALSDLGWKVLEFPDKEPAEFAELPDGAIEVRTDGSVAVLYREAGPGAETLTWRWRVDEVGPPSDLTQKGADDRPLAVHLWFPDEEMQSGFRGMVAELLGYPSYGRVLTYVWAPGEAETRRFPNPYMQDGQGEVIVLRDADDGLKQWREETVDVAADYRAAFGAEPIAPSYVAVSGDSDDLGGMSLGRVADIRLK